MGKLGGGKIEESKVGIGDGMEESVVCESTHSDLKCNGEEEAVS